MSVAIDCVYEIFTPIRRLSRENQRLKQAVDELAILNDVATAISSTMPLSHVVGLIVEKCVKHLEVEQGSVSLLTRDETQHPFTTMVRKAGSGKDGLPMRLTEELNGWMLHHTRSLLSNDLEHDDRFQGYSGPGTPIHSVLSSPLMLQGNRIGILSVFNKRSPEGFTEEDKRLLSIIAGQSALDITLDHSG